MSCKVEPQIQGASQFRLKSTSQFRLKWASQYIPKEEEHIKGQEKSLGDDTVELNP